MGVCIPKQVVLTNSHLTRLYYAMMFLTMAGMTTWFVASGGYLSSVSLRENVHLNMWVNEPTDEALSDPLFGMDDVCANPRDYDYWYDDHWHYNGSVCAQVSSTCKATHHCLRTRDIYAKEGPQRLWFTTYYKDSLHIRGAQSDAIHRYFVPQANAFRVNFQYVFTAPLLYGPVRFARIGMATADREHRMTNHDVMTVFLDANRDVAWVAGPGDSLNVTVPTLLELAGYPSQLTTPNPAWGENLYPGAVHPEGPIGLIGGLPLELYIQCYRQPLPNTDLGEAHRHWTGPTCFVVVSGREIWSTKYATFPSTAGMYDVDMSGIRVTGEMDGTWEYFDVNNCILNFTALLVLLSIPKRIIVWIACRALGHLSTIYRKAVFQKFVLAEEVAGMTARIVTYGASFREMEQDDEYGGVTRSNLHDTLRHVSRFRMEREASPGEEEERTIFGGRSSHARKTIDSNDIMLFADFAFKTIVNPERNSYRPRPCVRWFFRTRLWKVTEAILASAFGEDFICVQIDESRPGPFPRWTRQHHHESRISVDHFVTAAVMSELVDLDDMMWLFSIKRRIGRIERMFTPKIMADHLIGENRVALEALATRHAPAKAPPSFENEELGLDDRVSRWASNRTVSNRVVISSLASSLAENSRELHSELQLGCTSVIEQLRRVQTECDRLVGEGTRLGEELRAVQESCDRHAEHIESLRTEHGERRSPPTLTSESIEQRLATANDGADADGDADWAEPEMPTAMAEMPVGSEAAVPASSSQVATGHDEAYMSALAPRDVQTSSIRSAFQLRRTTGTAAPPSKSVPKKSAVPNGGIPHGAEEASHQDAAKEEDSGPTTSYMLHAPHLLFPRSALVQKHDDGSSEE